jgi:hypothetical protein
MQKTSAKPFSPSHPLAAKLLERPLVWAVAVEGESRWDNWAVAVVREHLALGLQKDTAQ